MNNHDQSLKHWYCYVSTAQHPYAVRSTCCEEYNPANWTHNTIYFILLDIQELQGASPSHDHTIACRVQPPQLPCRGGQLTPTVIKELQQIKRCPSGSIQWPAGINIKSCNACSTIQTIWKASEITNYAYLPHNFIPGNHMPECCIR